MKKLFLNVIALFTILLVIGTARIVEAAVSYTAQGTVSNSSGAGIAGLRVKIMEKRGNGENSLAETITNTSGNYSANFQGNSPINIGVQIYNGQTLLGSSEIHYNASRRETINVNINTQSSSRSYFFDGIIKTVSSFVSGVTSNFKIPSKKEIKNPTPTPTNSIISPTLSPTPSLTPTPTRRPTLTPTPILLPDLTLEAQEFSANVLPLRVKNIGSGPIIPIGSSQIPEVKILATWEDKNHRTISTSTKQLLDRDVMYSLGAGRYFPVTFSDMPWTAIYYTINVNAPAIFKESDANVGQQGANNQIAGSVPQADLIVEKVIFQPQTRRPIVTIKNIGKRVANFNDFMTFASMAYQRSNTTSLYKDVSAVFQYTSSTNPAYIHSGDSTQVAFGPPPDGAISYTAGVNENGTMPEDNINNNYLRGDNIPQPSPTPTRTPTPTSIPTRTPTPTSTPTLIPTPTTRPTNTPTPSPFPTDTPIPTNLPTVIPTESSPDSSSSSVIDDQSKIITSLSYPIAELGNCQSEEDCSNYCDIEENVSKCTDFAVKKGLMTQEEADLAKNATDTTNGPGGCGDIKSCAAFCDKPENINACLDYAKSNDLMSNEELTDAEKVVEIIDGNSKTPGDCQTPEQCQEYCTDQSHLDECLSFGEEVGLISKEESDDAKKMQDALQKGGPGGCHSSDECDSYCSDENHYEECNGFFEQVGINTSEENQGSQPENAAEETNVNESKDEITDSPVPTEESVAVESPDEEQSPTEEPAVEGVSTKYFLFDPLINWFRHLGK